MSPVPASFIRVADETRDGFGRGGGIAWPGLQRDSSRTHIPVDQPLDSVPTIRTPIPLRGR